MIEALTSFVIFLLAFIKWSMIAIAVVWVAAFVVGVIIVAIEVVRDWYRPEPRF